MNVTIEVTQEDIDNHLIRDKEFDDTCNSCQIARALTRTFRIKMKCARRVGTTEEEINFTGPFLPSKVQKISMLRIDNKKPFSFTIDVPKKWVKECSY